MREIQATQYDPTQPTYFMALSYDPKEECVVHYPASISADKAAVLAYIEEVRQAIATAGEPEEEFAIGISNTPPLEIFAEAK